MKAVLFVGHGSRDPAGNEQVRQFVDRMKGRIQRAEIIETCFLEFENPTVSEGLERCIEQGAEEIVVIPIILLAAGHTKLHIPAEIDEARRQHPHIRFVYGRPIGIHEEALLLCLERLEEIGEHIDRLTSDTTIILLGRGSSDPDANGDLYKIARLLWERLRHSHVEPAFMGVTFPRLEETVLRAVRLGAKRVIVIPYFLFTGILIKRLEKKMKDFQAIYPHVEFRLTRYFGFHPRLEGIILERTAEALQGPIAMNCDLCSYRLMMKKKMGNPHHDQEHGQKHHDHEHDHDHHNHAHTDAHAHLYRHESTK